MAGLVPGIHENRKARLIAAAALRANADAEIMDGRDTPGHDVFKKMIVFNLGAGASTARRPR
jgi:hypothetical protein